MPPAKRILIVDDEQALTYFLKRSLLEANADYVVEVAASGEEALKKAKQQYFDLFIVDLKLSGINGLEVAGAMRWRNPVASLILMTAYGSEEVEAEAQRLRVFRYITKPFDVEELKSAVREALRGK